ncbi:galactokinase [Martelella sp. HB161492]|uniref:GHMP family kinase ATP-binding protein n=1 Tax=Martelella sp. HB161492 TaxID=2720726 RepID=UPI00159244B0|nr:galactokinase [Martelella sp. HB161492]
MWISKTPLRASFLGGGTDYPSYFHKQPGAVLGGTIDKFVYIQALPLAHIAEQKYRITYRTTESVDNIDAIQHPVIREGLRHYKWEQPLNIATMSDLPGGTGLGSSSAFTVGLINLLHKMRGIELTRYELARQSIFMEQEILHEKVGVQDQIHAAFGGLSRYEFVGDTISIEPLRVTTSRLTTLNRSLLLVYTGGERRATEVTEEQEKRTRAGDNEAYLREMYEMTRIGAGVLEATGDDVKALQRFGDLLNHGWELKRNLGNTISNAQIDEIYLAGREMGAWGGKLLGAGGSGFVLFMADPELHPAFVERFGKDRVVPIELVSYGSQVLQQI